MIWIIIAIAIVFIMGKFFMDRDRMIETQVDQKGGMKVKYSRLIELLTNDASARIVEVKRDFIHIRSQGNPCSTDFFIIEHFNSTRIECVGNMGLLEVHKQEWSFPQNFSQEEMVIKVSSDIERKGQEIFNNFDMP